MGRYPSRDGLAIHPSELGFTIPTPEQIQAPRCVEYHHLYHYRRYYDQESDGYGAWRQVFRNMAVNVIPMLGTQHNRGIPGALHDKYSPPQMPKDAIMIDFVEQELSVNGLILLHNSRRSQPPRILQPSEWQAKKRRYKSGKTY